jgi:hypothetical protein
MESNRLKVVSLVKTCEACPSQWEAHLEDGRMLYIRYRWGNFNVYLSKSPSDKVLDALQGDNIISIEDYGEPLGGYIDDETMKSLLIEKFEF